MTVRRQPGQQARRALTKWPLRGPNENRKGSVLRSVNVESTTSQSHGCAVVRAKICMPPRLLAHAQLASRTRVGSRDRSTMYTALVSEAELPLSSLPVASTSSEVPFASSHSRPER